MYKLRSVEDSGPEAPEKASEMPTALIVDDDHASLDAMGTWVEGQGFKVRPAANVAAARRVIENERLAVALIDLDLPDGTGLELLEPLEEGQPAVDVIFITGHSSVDSAVEAFRGGAVDYLTKPVDLKRLGKLLAHSLRTFKLRGEITELRDQLKQLGRFGDLVGTSAPMQQVFDLVESVAPTDATVFVLGETGTGKEVVASTVHALSRRADKPFIAINCGAVAANLIESELFGHEKGSFTGAEKRRQGVFERAHGGTLFLDEITEMPIDLQVKLLRVLETRQLTRVGGDETIDVDVRIIAASNRDPQEAVRDEELREDLLYRLMIFPIQLPPLRERGDDVELLARHFLAKAAEAGGESRELSPGALARLRAYDWPGNVRELKHTIERATILAKGVIDESSITVGDALRRDTSGALPVGASIADVEKQLILATLDQLDGNKPKAAEVLGISLKTLYNRLNQYKGE